MKVKPAGFYHDCGERIDGVMYGNTPNGVVGITWPYPLNSPSPRFTQVNDSNRMLDQNWPLVPPADQDAWDAWVNELIARELCLLWDYWCHTRGPEAAAKAGYINCNQWRAVLNYPQSTTPPTDDLLPAGDWIEVTNQNPFNVIWHRPTGTPTQTTYLAQWVQVRNTRPARDIQARKFTFMAVAGFTMNEEINLQPVIDSTVKKWPGAFLQFGLAAGVRGSVPFSAFQAGVYQ